MLPARTLSPPNIFKPRRRPALSRPFLEEPPAFLCAIVTALEFCSSSYTDSVTESSHFFVPFAAGFLPFVAGFLALAAVFLPAAFFGAALVSPSAPSASLDASGFGLASRLGRGGGVSDGFLPSVRISVMRISENSWR